MIDNNFFFIRNEIVARKDKDIMNAQQKANCSQNRASESGISVEPARREIPKVVQLIVHREGNTEKNLTNEMYNAEALI